MILAGKPQSGCSQNSAGRGQILPILQANSCSIDQKSGENMHRPGEFAADFLQV